MATREINKFYYCHDKNASFVPVPKNSWAIRLVPIHLKYYNITWSTHFAVEDKQQVIISQARTQSYFSFFNQPFLFVPSFLFTLRVLECWIQEREPRNTKDHYYGAKVDWYEPWREIKISLTRFPRSEGGTQFSERLGGP